MQHFRDKSTVNLREMPARAVSLPELEIEREEVEEAAAAGRRGSFVFGHTDAGKGAEGGFVKTSLLLRGVAVQTYKLHLINIAVLSVA